MKSTSGFWHKVIFSNVYYGFKATYFYKLQVIISNRTLQSNLRTPLSPIQDFTHRNNK